MLVAPANATKIILPGIPVKQPDSVRVSARVENDEMSSTVECTVVEEDGVNLITCGW